MANLITTGADPEPESSTGTAAAPTAVPVSNESHQAEALSNKFRRVILGKPRDLRDKRIFHQISLIPFLAWVGLGADGL